MHVAMEYTIPYLGLDSEFVYGGLGKVVDTFIKVGVNKLLQLKHGIGD
jgi:hypothetical protein